MHNGQEKEVQQVYGLTKEFYMIKNSLLYLCLSLWALNSNAVLIDNGTYTTDTVSGLDWLDINVTAGMSYSASGQANLDWRYATNSEVENIFSILFDGWVDTGAGYSTTLASNSHPDQPIDVENFISLFGPSIEDITRPGLFFLSGYYLDEFNIQRIMGVALDTRDTPSTFGPYSQVLGMDYTGGSYNSNTIDYRFGTYLVRTSTVPIPGAIWLFGSGLIGLIGMARRKIRA